MLLDIGPITGSETLKTYSYSWWDAILLKHQTNPNAEEPHLPSIAQVFFQELGSIDGCATHFAHECQWMVLIQVSNSTCSNKKVL